MPFFLWWKQPQFKHNPSLKFPWNWPNYLRDKINKIRPSIGWHWSIWRRSVEIRYCMDWSSRWRKPGWGGGGGETPIEKWQEWLSYLLGVKIRGLVPLKVLKPKMTSVRGMVVPFWVLSSKIMRGSMRGSMTILPKYWKSGRHWKECQIVHCFIVGTS